MTDPKKIFKSSVHSNLKLGGGVLSIFIFVCLMIPHNETHCFFFFLGRAISFTSFVQGVLGRNIFILRGCYCQYSGQLNGVVESIIHCARSLEPGHFFMPTVLVLFFVALFKVLNDSRGTMPLDSLRLGCSCADVDCGR